MNCPHPLESWDRGFESHSRHGCVCVCVCVFTLFVLPCVQVEALRRAFPRSPTDSIQVQELEKRPRPLIIIIIIIIIILTFWIAITRNAANVIKCAVRKYFGFYLSGYSHYLESVSKTLCRFTSSYILCMCKLFYDEPFLRKYRGGGDLCN
jgi:hypothetical protein